MCGRNNPNCSKFVVERIERKKKVYCQGTVSREREEEGVLLNNYLASNLLSGKSELCVLVNIRFSKGKAQFVF